ncbi:MAG: hypothetical protein IPN92_16240 [Chromatiaceae bacterium]|nr:hypothetical protein [Chromatiaceae bacterium]
MMITAQTLAVGPGGDVNFQVASPQGARIRVIVHDEKADEQVAEQTAIAHLQDKTGFAREVLANPAEDIWNDL